MIDSSRDSDSAPEAGAEGSEPAAQPNTAGENAEGLRMSDILDLPGPMRELINWMIRKREVGLADLAARLGQDEASVRSTVADLVNRGYLWETRLPEETRYRVRFAPQRRHQRTLLDI